MIIFVTDFTVDHVVAHVQGFSSGILMIFVLETVLDMKESGVTCGSRARLTCNILVYRCT